MTYTVVYLTDNNDLYWEEFNSIEEAMEYIENDICDYKAQLIKGSHVSDHT